MLSQQTILTTLRAAKPELEKKYKVRALALFGSYSRNDATSLSDIDLLVDLDSTIGILFVDLADELEEMLQHKVDLVSLNGIQPKYLNAINQDLIYVWKGHGLLIEDMLKSADKIIAYTKGMDYETFLADDKTIDAVVRNFEIIGEAAKRIPDDFKLMNKEIQWRRIIGFRNRIIHEYFGIDYIAVWTIKEEYLPELVECLNNLSSK